MKDTIIPNEEITLLAEILSLQALVLLYSSTVGRANLDKSLPLSSKEGLPLPKVGTAVADCEYLSTRLHLELPSLEQQLTDLTPAISTDAFLGLGGYSDYLSNEELVDSRDLHVITYERLSKLEDKAIVVSILAIGRGEASKVMKKLLQTKTKSLTLSTTTTLGAICHIIPTVYAEDLRTVFTGWYEAMNMHPDNEDQ